MDYNNQDADVVAVKSDGTLATFTPATGNTITAATFYFPLGHGGFRESSMQTATLLWAAAVAGTLTVEVTNAPRYVGGASSGPVDVSDYDATAGNWIPWNPATATPNIVQVTGTGNSATAYTITLGGTNAGGAAIQLAQTGFRRARLKLVASVGGNVRCTLSGKLGA